MAGLIGGLFHGEIINVTIWKNRYDWRRLACRTVMVERMLVAENFVAPFLCAISTQHCPASTPCTIAVHHPIRIYRRGNVENDWKSSIVCRSPSKAIIGFPMISDYFQCRKCRFPDVDPRRKCQGFCALKSSEFRLNHALRNSLSVYCH